MTMNNAATVLDWFLDSCARFSDRVAIDFGQQQISYRSLLEQSNQVTNCLTERGCTVGAFIALSISDPVHRIIALLGVMRGGMTVVPLNSESPPGILKHKIRQINPAALIFDHGNDSSFDSVPQQIDYTEISSYPMDAVRLDVLSQSQAYIYFSSGSTDSARGIVGNLAGLSNFIQWEIEEFKILSGYRTSQLIAPTFDAFLRDIFLPLCSGGTLCIPPANVASLDAQTFFSWLAEKRINVIHVVPAHLTSLFRYYDADKFDLRNLKFVMSSGDHLPKSFIEYWLATFAGSPKLVNLYGSTEATLVQFSHIVTEDDLSKRRVPIGKPINGVQYIIVSEEDNGTPEMGELYLQSPFLSFGYYADDELTKKRFVPHPLNKDQYVWYRTGDIIEVLENGDMILVGRRDNQVKINGVRVNPESVAAVLDQYPEINASVVLPLRNKHGVERLTAFVAPAGRYPPAIPELRAYLAQMLEQEMLPADILILDEFPLTENGKVDSLALVKQAKARQPLLVMEEEPVGEMEIEIARIWQNALNLNDIAREAHFQALGGHSLTATQIINQYQALLGREISYRDFFDHPTIVEQAKLLMNDGEIAANVKAAVTEPITLANDGHRQCSLVIVINNQMKAESFERLAQRVMEIDPMIKAIVLDDSAELSQELPKEPLLVFSPAFIRNLGHSSPPVLSGLPLSKSEEYQRLGDAGVPVPPWTLLEKGSTADTSSFGKYVVRKPNWGARGASVQLVRSRNIKWKTLSTRAAGISPSMIIQKFIYTGEFPASYRVNTFFHKVLYAVKMSAAKSGPPLAHPEIETPSGSSIVTNCEEASLSLTYDQEVMDLAVTASTAFADIPLLGIDILREATTGNLYVIEVNATGYNWNFFDHWDVDIENQFDGFNRAAMILAEKTRELAE